ncbi:MAG: hypothetical protein P8Z37_13130 [Acidobacteriota bacterium]
MLKAAGHKKLFQSGLVAVMIFSALCSPALAQYFGQNKVRYNDFDFKILKTENFDIFYYPEEEKIISQVGRMAERWYYRLSTVFGFKLSTRQALIVYADHPDFQQTLVIPGVIGESTGGVTESVRRRIVLPLAGPLKNTDHVIGHELVHAFQYDLSSRAARSGVSSSMQSLPLWFIEGMAEYLSLGPVDAFTSMWLRDAVLREEFPKISDLDSSRYFPYRWGHAVWAFIAGNYGDDVLGEILRNGIKSGDAKKSISAVLNVSTETLSEQWHQSLKNQYKEIFERTDGADTRGSILVSKKKSDTELNVSPAISPDGKHAILFSEKSLFGINLYLIDAGTGKFLHKITETEISPHFINLQFTNATGGWSPDSRRFAFASVRGSTPELSIYDVVRNKITDKIPVKDVGEIYSLSWSPDAGKIVFSGIDGGVSDIFIMDLESRQLTRITDDAYGDLQPSWSPDGESIAFVSDRFTTDLEELVFGEFRLVLYDQKTGGIRELHGFAFIEGGYEVVRTGTGTAAGSPIPGTEIDRRVASMLPPLERKSDTVLSLLQAPERGLKGTGQFKTEKYKAGLHLEGISPVNVSVGTGQYGTMVGGGIGFYFSDRLNYHELGFELQSTTFSGGHLLRNLSGVGTYLDKRHRWTWGISGGQVPYLTTGFSQGVDQINGEPVIVQSDTIFWEIDRQIVGLLQYPFNRAMRIEFSTGFRNLDFAASREIYVFDPVTGTLLGSDSQDINAPNSLFLSTSSAALVYDTSIFGGVSPVIGQRYRIETGINAGSLVYATVLADYRRYFQITRPLSVAGRILHYGRYGTGSEDPRMQQLFLGYSSLVRGYEAGSIDAIECGADLGQTGSCPLVNRLAGSRIGVAGVEARFEILGPLGIVPSRSIPPVQIAPFFDAGIAWTGDDTPDFFGGDRSGITSHGASLRFNVFGYLIGQLSLVHPNDRPEKDWLWEFSFIPGF